VSNVEITNYLYFVYLLKELEKAHFCYASLTTLLQVNSRMTVANLRIDCRN